MVSFVTTDTTTQGSWKGSYGRDGYVIVRHNNVTFQPNPSGRAGWYLRRDAEDPALAIPHDVPEQGFLARLIGDAFPIAEAYIAAHPIARPEADATG